MADYNVLLDVDSSFAGAAAPVQDLSVGGQQGALQVPEEIWSNGSYVTQRVIPFVVEYPLAIQWTDNPEYWRKAIKHLMEVSKTRIDGLNGGVRVDYEQQPIGNWGDNMSTPSRAEIESSSPAYTWGDVTNATIQRFWTQYIKMFIMDPALGRAGITTQAAYIAAGSPTLLPEHKSLTMLFVEPDESTVRPVHAWLCSNMMPDTGGEVNGTFETHYTGERKDVSITWTAVTMPVDNTAVLTMAKTALGTLAIENTNPLTMKGYLSDISSDVAAIATGFVDAY